MNTKLKPKNYQTPSMMKIDDTESEWDTCVLSFWCRQQKQQVYLIPLTDFLTHPRLTNCFIPFTVHNWPFYFQLKISQVEYILRLIHIKCLQKQSTNNDINWYVFFLLNGRWLNRLTLLWTKSFFSYTAVRSVVPFLRRKIVWKTFLFVWWIFFFDQ